MAQPDAVLYAGRWFTVESIRLDDGSLPLREFIEGLDDGDRIKVLALIERLADTGKIWNEQKCKKVAGTELFELKSFQIRILWFYAPERRVVLAHHVIKKGDRLRGQDIERAERMRTQYLKNLNKK